MYLEGVAALHTELWLNTAAPPWLLVGSRGMQELRAKPKANSSEAVSEIF